MSWDLVVGQTEAVRRLQAAVDAPVHAYLFVGPAGAGKMRAAEVFAGELLAAGSGTGTERYAVVKLHVIANLARFSDHRARAVIDKKVMTDLRAGMQIHAGPFVGPLGHYTW